MKSRKPMKTVRQVVARYDASGEVEYVRGYALNPDTGSMEVSFTPMVNDARVWNHAGHASNWLRRLVAGSWVMDARQIEGWVEK